jgi:hypothetical protein
MTTDLATNKTPPVDLGARVALRHGNAATCVVCGKSIVPKRGSRRQRYCCRFCKKRAQSAANWARRCSVPDRIRSVQNKQTNSGSCEGGFASRGSTKGVLRQAIEVEVIARHDWTPTVSSDGVFSYVTYLAPPALVRPAL